MPHNGTHTFDFDNSAARLRYFLGQVLTQRDFELEQRYHVMLQRLVQREAFGTGTVVGLEVRDETTEGGSVSQSVFVTPGLAFDSDGRELILERQVTIEVAAPMSTPTPSPFGTAFGSLDDLAAATADRFLGPDLETFATRDLEALEARLVEVGFLDTTGVTGLQEAIELIPVPDPVTGVPVVSPPELLSEWLFDQLVGTTNLGLAYRESGTSPAPATLDASCCGERTCFASRTQEGVTVVAQSSAFPVLVDPSVEFGLTLDAQFLLQIDNGGSPAQLDCHAALCAALVSGRPGAPPWRAVPRVSFPCGDTAFPVVPLARIFWQRFEPDDDSPQILSIDNCTFRPLAPGVPALRALVESLTRCASPPNFAPRIVSVFPADGAEVLAVNTQPTPPNDEERLLLRAVFNAAMVVQGGGAPDESHLWEIVYYPAAGDGGIEVFTPSGSGGGNDGPNESKVHVEFASDGDVTRMDIRFNDGSAFSPGTYVWRILNGAVNLEGVTSSAVVAEESGVQLDGEPHPQGAVPSGNGVPGGVFEARFFIRV